MSTVAAFISPTEIKREAYVDENVDEKYILNTILFAQELYIKEVLGSALYDEIKTQVLASTLTADNTTLLNTYIKPSLRYWVLFEAVDMFHLKITNKGIVKKRGENSDNASTEDIQMLKDKFQNLAERNDKRMILFLCENEDTYPLYINPGNGVDTIYPKGSTYDTGWYLGESTNCELDED